MRFKDFIEQDDSTTKSHVDMMANGDKEADPFGSTTTFHASPTTIVNGKVAQIVAAVRALDPYIQNRGGTSISGTPDFMAPELSNGVATDPDSISYMYASLNSKQPQVAALLRPLLPLVQRFLSNVVNMMNSNYSENAEMIARLDVRHFEEIQKGMEAIRQALTKLTPEDLKLPTFAGVVSSFKPLYTRFRMVSDRLSQALASQYQQVQHLKWDQT